jgi:four helix bundle protein
MGAFRDLRVWKEAKQLAVEIYTITQQGSFAHDPALRDQIRRSAVSIPSNLAESDERQSNREAVRFFYIAKGSLAELQTQLEIAREIGYLDAGIHSKLDLKCSTLGKMLGSLIKVRSSTNHP